MKYIHIACGIAGIVVPLIPVIAQMVAFGREVQSSDELRAANVTFVSGGLGFATLSFPQILCAVRNGTVAYYSYILLLNIAFFAGIAELIFLLGIVHRVSF